MGKLTKREPEVLLITPRWTVVVVLRTWLIPNLDGIL